MKFHVCDSIDSFPIEKFHQLGQGKGRRLLIVGESPAPNGWRLSGIACYRSDGSILPTGKRLNELLEPFGLSVEKCGFTELVKCYVSKRTELQKCAERCFPILLDQLKGKEYRLIVILGVQTTKILSSILQHDLIVGTLQNVKLGRKTYAILPIYHPSPVNPNGRRQNQAIMKRLSKKISLLLK